ncbi:KGK domain-containing protein [Alkalinema sp. FACHB-956]|uniref:KGK domain-containing protein n=1 Tax=Alkalinema sp. FACHB-956 TaxID=2692768 RepID=UPI0016841EBB|nr:KGK domain-containing protein [Alkalinema sp. FACHB-956]MBD2326424.1 hypothetical protein [Alkalinema sp. FACHB-956]
MTNPKSMNLSNDDLSVITFKHDRQGNLLQDDAFVISHLIQRIKRKLANETSLCIGPDEGQRFASDGIPCKYLALGSHRWISGKVRLALEFIPDEPETPEEISALDSGASPLDGIRQEISND